MTSALPYFMLPISKMMIALNQNLVKVETSKVFTPLERQVLAMIHRTIYDKSDDFYDANIQNPNTALWRFLLQRHHSQHHKLMGCIKQPFPKKKGFDGLAEEGVDFCRLRIRLQRRRGFSVKTRSLLTTKVGKHTGAG